jgi:zinc transporter, ZIP family
MLKESLYWSMAAGLGTLVGALLVFLKRHWTSKSLAFFLGLASGVMVAVVVFDMLPSAFLYSGFYRGLLGLAIGALIMMISDWVIFSRAPGVESLSGLGYLIMLGIALHDLPEGMAIGLGDALKSRTGIVIATGIGIHNIPEGMAIAVPLLMAGIRKPVILLQILAVCMITPLGTVVGSILTAMVPALLPLLLGIASGIMSYLVFFQLWPQATEKDQNSRWWGLILGIILIAAATFL